jgi:hypothetical protein
VPRTHVVILSGRSIFAEGVASRLRQNLDELEIDVVDIREPDALDRTIAARPATVILDATDADAANGDWLGGLLNALPMVQLVRVDPLQDRIQVVTSEQRPMGQVDELIDVIKKSDIP